jgi:hypothetical protein
MPRASTGGSPAVSHPVPPQEPGHHNWAELLRLVDDVRRLAYDCSLGPGDAMRRIRDRFGVYDGIINDDE